EPGFIEPFFGIRTEEGTGKKGSISHGGIGVSSDLPYNHKVTLGYSLYQYSRKTDDANNMDFDVNAVSLTYGYPILYRLRSKMYFNVGSTFLAVDGKYFSEWSYIMQTSFNLHRLWGSIISICDRLIRLCRSLLIQGILYRTTARRHYSWVIMMPFLPVLG
ncbi:MAG: hypothetical protein HW406_1857, partial [Candidatus Brocadiaceae bacterium]|nr:hypothetical protein [Candidatus Brocadiaceae bacterium]